MAFARVVFLAISMVFFSSVAMATNHIVGDDKGWTVDYNYTQWAQDKVFHVGDNLVFNYNAPKHNIFKVNGTLYQNCTFPPINEALSTGKDIIQLKTEGRKWYVCGKSDHCAARQMKLAINVVTEGPAPAPSAAHSVVSYLPKVIMASIVVAVSAIFA